MSFWWAQHFMPSIAGTPIISRPWSRRVRILIPTNHRNKYDLKTLPRIELVWLCECSPIEPYQLGRFAPSRSDASPNDSRATTWIDFVEAFLVGIQTRVANKEDHVDARSLASAVVTNLGDLAKLAKRLIKLENGRVYVGDKLEMTGIFGVPPIRQGTPIGIGACHVGIVYASLFNAILFLDSPSLTSIFSRACSRTGTRLAAIVFK